LTSGQRLFVVMGPTASGKSSLAEDIARELDCFLVNGDAFQVYRGLTIGTAKPQDTSRYHLIDIKNPEDEYGVGEYVVSASDILWQEFEAGRDCVLVGGTGFYIRALVEQYQDLSPSPPVGMRESFNSMSLEELVEQLLEKDSDCRHRVDLKNRIRVTRALEKLLTPEQSIRFSLPPFEVHKIALVSDVESSKLMIINRTTFMLENGWIEEVSGLLDSGLTLSAPGFRAIGYRLLASNIREKLNLQPDSIEELIDSISLETIQYAKRQRTWLRSEPRLQTFLGKNDAMSWFQSISKTS
jgi:tRNA dimethylallyltransferase